MNKLFNIYMLVLAILMAACTSDPLSDLDGKGWQKERNISDLIIKGQIGAASIERNFEEASIEILVNYAKIEDFSKVEVVDIQLSYGATASVSSGSYLTFVDDHSSIVVTSASGESLVWDVSIHPLVSEMKGTWYIEAIEAYCDFFTYETWGWDETISIPELLPSALPELDNVIVCTDEGIDEKGNPFGTYDHKTGDDGAYGQFVDIEREWDFNERFRNIPIGKGTWLFDIERNKVVITDAKKIEYELDIKLNEDGTIALKAPLVYDTSDYNWDNTDYSYEKLAHVSNSMWYTLTKDRVLQTGNSIESITIANQVGSASINSGDNVVDITVEMYKIADLSQVELITLGISSGASSSIEAGSKLDFSVENKTTITVTSEAGEAVSWIVQLKPALISPIAGTWSVAAMETYCDYFSWETWGKTEVLNLTEHLPESAPEMDNKISFVQEGVDENGNAIGSFSNNKGADNAYGEFVNVEKDWDVNYRFRQIPSGEGRWVHNTEANTVTITVNGEEVVLNLIADDVNGTIKIEVPLTYESEKFNWSDIDFAYEFLFHLSNSMWYTLNNRVN